MDAQDAEILNLESQLGLAKADCRDLQNQMSIINSLFTQMLLGASSAEMDLDRLTQLLQVGFLHPHYLCCQLHNTDTFFTKLPSYAIFTTGDSVIHPVVIS